MIVLSRLALASSTLLRGLKHTPVHGPACCAARQQGNELSIYQKIGVEKGGRGARSSLLSNDNLQDESRPRGGFIPNRNPSIGWCKVPPAVPFLPAVPFCTMVSAEMKPPLGPPRFVREHVASIAFSKTDCCWSLVGAISFEARSKVLSNLPHLIPPRRKSVFCAQPLRNNPQTRRRVINMHLTSQHHNIAVVVVAQLALATLISEPRHEIVHFQLASLDPGSRRTIQVKMAWYRRVPWDIYPET